MKLKSLNVALAILISLGVVACKSNDQGTVIDKPKVVNSGSSSGSTGGDTGSTGSNTGSTGSNAGSTSSNTGSIGSDAGSTDNNTSSASSNKDSVDGTLTVTFKDSDKLSSNELNALELLSKDNSGITTGRDSKEKLDSGTLVAGYNQQHSAYLVIRDGSEYENSVNDFIAVVKNPTPVDKKSTLDKLNATYNGQLSAGSGSDLDVLGMPVTFNLRNGKISGNGTVTDEDTSSGQAVKFIIKGTFGDAPIAVKDERIAFAGKFSATEQKEGSNEVKTLFNSADYNGVFAGPNGEEIIGKFEGTFTNGEDKGKKTYGTFGAKIAK